MVVVEDALSRLHGGVVSAIKQDMMHVLVEAMTKHLVFIVLGSF